jgi:hypothetical protein
MSVTDEYALNAYIAGVEAEALAKVFARHLPEFTGEFERVYGAWRTANADALTRGAEVATARGMTGDAGPSIGRFATLQAQIIEDLPQDDRQRRCAELLARLA